MALIKKHASFTNPDPEKIFNESEYLYIIVPSHRKYLSVLYDVIEQVSSDWYKEIEDIEIDSKDVIVIGYGEFFQKLKFDQHIRCKIYETDAKHSSTIRDYLNSVTPRLEDFDGRPNFFHLVYEGNL